MTATEVKAIGGFAVAGAMRIEFVHAVCDGLHFAFHAVKAVEDREALGEHGPAGKGQAFLGGDSRW